jgi:small-conductance mechanosensitive channel
MREWIDILTRNTGSTWLTAGALFISLMAGVAITRYFASRYLSTYASRTRTQVDDIIVLLVDKTNLVIIAIVAMFLAEKTLIMPEKLSQTMRIVAVSAVFLQIALWGNAIINFFLSEAIQRAGQQEVNISARRAIAFLSRFVLWLLVFTLLLENLGVKLSPLLTGIGIGGVAIALAIQNILGDLFCYVAIILDKPFIAGDFLVIDDFMGTVERIGLKTTRIRSLTGELLILANHDLVNSRVRNYKTMQERRVVFKFGVTYDTPLGNLKKIPELVKSIYDSLQNVRLDRVHFAQFGDFSLNYEVAYYILSGDYNMYMDIQQEIGLMLIHAFGKESIDFAFPTQSLYVQSIQSKNDRANANVSATS